MCTLLGHPQTTCSANQAPTTPTLITCRNLLLLEQAGAQVLPFSPLADSELPRGVAMVYLSGSSSTLLLQHEGRQLSGALAANRGMLASIAAFAEAGGLVLAEGAGLVYLSQCLQHDQHAMHAMGK